MSSHQVAMGAEVRSSDGNAIGQVEHLIIDANTNALTGFVGDKGIFDSGRVVDLGYVSSVSEDAVLLSLTEDEAKNLPGFAQHQYSRFDPGTMYPSGGVGGVWIPIIPGAGAIAGAAGAQLSYVQGVEEDVTARSRSPLTESDIVLDTGTDVVDVNGDKVGQVDEVIIGVDDRVEGFVIKQGFVFHHDVHVPAAWVEAISHEHVRLSVSKDQVEQSKR